jgi:hypothetical protein
MRSSAGAHVVFFSQQRWRVFFLRTRFLHRLTASTQADTSATPLSSLPTSREPPFASSAVCCSWRALKSRTRPARGRNSLSQNGRARAKRQQTRSQLAGMAKMCCVEEEETTATNKNLSTTSTEEPESTNSLRSKTRGQETHAAVPSHSRSSHSRCSPRRRATRETKWQSVDTSSNVYVQGTAAPHLTLCTASPLLATLHHL